VRRVILTVLFGTLLLVAPAVAAAKLPGVLTGNRFVVRPSIIDYTGDASAIVGGGDGSGINHPGHLKWTTYNKRQGIATGTIWIDNCVPNCAQGRFTGSRVKVNAYSPSGGHFRRVKLTYNYQGDHHVDLLELERFKGPNGPIYQYSIR
jgi:hypothetical protein